MDQEVISVFKVNCLKRTFAPAMTATEEDTEKILIQFWKDYNVIASRMFFVLRVMSDDFKGCAKKDEVAKINKAVVEMTKDFNLGVDGDDIKDFLEAVPEELNDEEVLELDQEHIAEE